MLIDIQTQEASSVTDNEFSLEKGKKIVLSVDEDRTTKKKKLFHDENESEKKEMETCDTNSEHCFNCKNDDAWDTTPVLVENPIVYTVGMENRDTVLIAEEKKHQYLKELNEL